MNVLSQLVSEEFAMQFWHIATPPAVYRALKRSRVVGDISNALKTGQLTEDVIGEFVSGLMNDLRENEPFQHDLAMAAIAVALEDRASDFAEAYLQSLAALQIAQMPMSSRVARECLRKREAVMARTTKAEGVISPPVVSRLIFINHDDLHWRFPGNVTGEVRNEVCC